MGRRHTLPTQLGTRAGRAPPLPDHAGSIPGGHPDRNKSEKKHGEQRGHASFGTRNMVKSLWGTRKERKTFQVSTETQMPPPPLRWVLQRSNKVSMAKQVSLGYWADLPPYNASVKSKCAHHPTGHRGAFSCKAPPGGWAFELKHRPGGQGIWN